MADKAEEQEKRLREAAESYEEIEKLIAPFRGKRYKRVVTPDKWSQGDQRLAKATR